MTDVSAQHGPCCSCKKERREIEAQQLHGYCFDCAVVLVQQAPAQNHRLRLALWFLGTTRDPHIELTRPPTSVENH